MNINSVSFQGQVPISRIKLARNLNNKELPVNDYVRDMLATHNEELEKVANFFDRDVVIAQKANLLLINSGVKTSVLDMSKMKHGSEVVTAIKMNIVENNAIPKTGFGILNRTV